MCSESPLSSLSPPPFTREGCGNPTGSVPAGLVTQAHASARMGRREMLLVVISMDIHGICGCYFPSAKRKQRANKAIRKREAKAYSTWYSQAVSHPSTNQARPCLASEIGRDRACSGWYGRKRRQRLQRGLLYTLSGHGHWPLYALWLHMLS